MRGEEIGVFGPAAGFGDESRGDDSGVVAAFEGIGFFAGAGVAVEVFLCRTGDGSCNEIVDMCM